MTVLEDSGYEGSEIAGSGAGQGQTNHQYYHRNFSITSDQRYHFMSDGWASANGYRDPPQSTFSGGESAPDQGFSLSLDHLEPLFGGIPSSIDESEFVALGTHNLDVNQELYNITSVNIHENTSPVTSHLNLGVMSKRLNNSSDDKLSKRRKHPTSRDIFNSQPETSSTSGFPPHIESQQLQFENSYVEPWLDPQQMTVQRSTSNHINLQHPQSSQPSSLQPYPVNPHDGEGQITNRSSDRKHPCRQCGKSFHTLNDLDRHDKGVHCKVPPGTKVYNCQIDLCVGSTKVWTRLDNFKQHISRMHKNKNPDIADNMSIWYNPEVHDLKPKGKKKNEQASSLEELVGEIVSTEAAAVTSQRLLHSPNPGIQAKRERRSEVGTSGGGDVIAYNNCSQKSVNHSVNSRYGPPRVQRNIRRLNANRQYIHGRSSVSQTIANPETAYRQRQEIEDMDRFPSLLDGNPSPSAESALAGLRYDESMIAPLPEKNDMFGYAMQDRQLRLDAALPVPSDNNKMNVLLEIIHGLGPKDQEHIAKMLRQRPCHSGGSLQVSGGAPKLYDRSELSSQHGASEFHCSFEGCSKAFRQCSELKKHAHRHLRKYGCTFDSCFKRFGTRWEWKRHETNQHVQNEEWRCGLINGNGVCHEHFIGKTGLVRHLGICHDLNEDYLQQNSTYHCLTKKWNGSFWCGFCSTIVLIRVKAEEGTTDERYSHISNHIKNGGDMKMWVELKGHGRCKEEMKAIDADGSLKPKSEKEDFSPDCEEPNSSQDEDEEGDGDGMSESLNQQSLGLDTQQHDSNRGSQQNSATGHNSRRAKPPSIITPAAEDKLVSPPALSFMNYNTYNDRPRSASDTGKRVLGVQDQRVAQDIYQWHQEQSIMARQSQSQNLTQMGSQSNDVQFEPNDFIFHNAEL